jgi:succinoglycan biosynthesis protein ExoV
VPDFDWAGLCEQAGVHYISSTWSVDECLAQLEASELVITEAMHGAILADAYRVPWIPMRYGYRSFDFKWHDWCRSMGLSYEPVDLPNLLDAKLEQAEFWGRVARRGLCSLRLGKEKWRRAPLRRSSAGEVAAAVSLIKRLSSGDRARLSSDAAFESARQRLDQCFEELCADLRAGAFPSAGRLRS